MIFCVVYDFHTTLESEVVRGSVFKSYFPRVQLTRRLLMLSNAGGLRVQTDAYTSPLCPFSDDLLTDGFHVGRKNIEAP